ncbi:MAG: DUF2971 domain-containing protein [Anaerolineaceae bacterium]|nr:MAG: DUF2971 domain-containing protein [Anaerolineaceae bacterium]
MANNSIIYHYTTISGIIGIITHRELWASDCQFLNDGAELSYAKDIYFAEIQKLNLPPLEDGGYRIAGHSLLYFRMFVACFCEDGDLLSQWRGYGADQGYALGFDIEKLRSLNIGEVVPVQYGIANPAEFFSKEIRDAAQPTAHPGVVEWHTSEWLLPRLARVKHPSFSEEREWRILKQETLFDLSAQNPPTQFRSSSMGPIPYLVITFPPECLREIIIGPGNHTGIRLNAVQSLLQYNGFSEVNIRLSEIPFRR